MPKYRTPSGVTRLIALLSCQGVPHDFRGSPLSFALVACPAQIATPDAASFNRKTVWRRL
jgi:hypothetical protein